MKRTFPSETAYYRIHFLVGGLFAAAAIVAFGMLSHGERAMADGPAQPPAVKLLFLGDKGHHQPRARFDDLQPALAGRNITMEYTDKLDDINPENLAKYDGLIVFANIDNITPEAAKALIDYVEGGKGFIPLHCASYCFRNSPEVVALIGGQFLKHSTGTFRTELANTDNPIMKGFGGFESWDETYVHTKHNEKDRTVLEYRVDAQGREPYTWIRTQGKGRVFYTAWGHDQRTWRNPGFVNLVERGIRWAVGGDPGVVPAFDDGKGAKGASAADPKLRIGLNRKAFAPLEMTTKRTDVKPFEYDSDVTVPLYQPRSQGQQHQMQKAVEAAESQKHMVTPAGFAARLFASEPEIGKPLCMAWDERGRLWIGETLDYPNNPQPEGKGHDRIRILEDTDGDGRADKFTTFAENVSIPTSICFANGGVIVQESGNTLFLKDTNGDDVADERKVLIKTWGSNDTHAAASNQHYGLDNWIYGIVGYSGFEGTVGGEQFNFRQALYRFKPDGSKMELLRNTSNNSWGVGITEEGYLFGSTANGNPSVHMTIPDRYYEAVRGMPSPGNLPMIAVSNDFHPIVDSDKVRQVDWFGKFTAGAGHEIYTARTYPQDFWNRAAFVCEPTGHLVATFVLSQKGANFSDRYDWNLLASDDEWTAPIVASVGPDGNVWVVDWYNYIVQHNPTPHGFQTGRGNAYESALRDKSHARIYRVVSKDAKPEPRMSLAGADADTLVKTLRNPNMFWRLHAQRMLVERGKVDVVPQLIALVNDQTIDEIGLNVSAIHALGVLSGLSSQSGFPTEQANAAVKRAIGHPSAGVAYNALQMLPPTSDSADAILSSNLARDPDAKVRLAALLALSTMPPRDNAAEAMVKLIGDSNYLGDYVLRDAVVFAAARNDQRVIELLAAAGKNLQLPGDHPGQGVIRRVSEHYARGSPKEKISALLVSLGQSSSPALPSIVAGLARGWPKEGAKVALDAPAQDALMKIMSNLESEHGSLTMLADRLGAKAVLDAKSTELAGKLLSQVQDEQQPEQKRIEAASELVQMRPTDAQTVLKFVELLDSRVSPEFGAKMLDVISHSESKEVGAKLAERLPELTAALRTSAVGALLTKTDWTSSLLDALEQRRISLGDMTLDQKQQLTAILNPKNSKRASELLARGGGLPDADRQKVVDEFTSALEMQGNAAAGKLVFTKNCAKCHTHAEAQAIGKVGPDLTGMAVHTKKDLMIDILDPSRSVEGTFRAYTIRTADGRQIVGLLAAENRTAVEILDAEGKSHSILREDIEPDGVRTSRKSLMPDGFEKQITRDDLVNLLTFLTTRGKYLPIPLDKAATVVTTKGMFFEDESEGDRIVFDDWSPKTFAGVQFRLIDPSGGRFPNAVMLNGPQGNKPPHMPKSVELPCNSPAKAIHMLSGVSGWGYPASEKQTVSMIVRLRYADGQTEDHPLVNGQEFADYNGLNEVPGSKLAFNLAGHQVRYLAIEPKRSGEVISKIELVKGPEPDVTAPLVFAVTLEMPGEPDKATANASGAAGTAAAKGSG